MIEKLFKIVLVRWIDTQRIDIGMQRVEEFEDIEPLYCEIVGFLIKEDEKKIVLAQELWENNEGIKYIHIIPKCSIKKVIYLKLIEDKK